jgi:chorismate mutase
MNNPESALMKPLAPGETAVGLVQHPYTKCYQVWLSATGADVILVSARHRRVDAEADIQKVKAVLGSQDYYDAAKVATLLSRLRNASDEEPQPLPSDLINQICRAILYPSSR